MFYPYLKGIARDCGAESRWLFFVGSPSVRWDRPVGRTLRAHIPAADAARLKAELARFAPTHVVCNELPSEELSAALASAGEFKFLVMPCEFDMEALAWGERMPELEAHLARVSGRPEDRTNIHRPAWFADWLGLAHPREGEHLLDATVPDYEARKANDGENFNPGFPLIIAGGQSCRGRPKVASNPRFRHLAGVEGFHPGCSFCGGADEQGTLSRHRQGSLALAQAQLRRLDATPPEKSRGRGTYIIHDLALFMRIDSFFKMVRDNGFKPAKFVFCPRIDDVLHARARVEAILPLAAAGGHRIGFDIMGIENFSPETMELYNKNITVAQADELVALMTRWREKWPQVFDPFPGAKNWLMLLFTPWTTPAELRVNYDEASRRGFDSDHFWICTSLMLRKGSALEALALEEGGILVPDYEDKGLLFFPALGMQAMWGSRPWRFKDPRVADFYRVLIRIYAALERPDSRALFGDDPEFDLFASIFCGKQPGEPLERPAWSLLAVARVLLDLIEAAPEPRSREALLREAVARIKAATPARPAAARAEGPSRRSPLGALERTAIDEVGRLLASGKSKSLAGISVASAEAVPEEKAVRLNLIVDERPLTLVLRPASEPGPSFLQSGSFKVVYQTGGPEWTGKALSRLSSRLTLLVELLDRRLTALSARR